MAARVTCGCGWEARYASAALAEAFSRRHVCRQTDRIRRATRRHRCARCGFVATYDNAGAAEARYWFSKHSCRKREMAMVRSAQAQQQYDLVDHTPKPCLHKVASHEHGTYVCYVLDLCRCPPCTEANRVCERERNRLKAYGRYNRYVPALPVREHIAMLRESGMGLKAIAKQAGIGTGTISKIVYGVYKDTGLGGLNRKGQGELIRQPNRRVLRETAEKIYAIDPAWNGGRVPLLPGCADPDGTPLARQRLQSLVALGWSMSEIGRRLGGAFAHPGNACALFSETSRNPAMQRRTVDAVATLFEQLSMTVPPETTRGERISASRARNLARANGWVPPLELEDLDDAAQAADVEDIDEVAVQRRIDGDTTVPLNRAERLDVVRRLHGQGLNDREIGRRTGIHSDQVKRDRKDLDLPGNQVRAIIADSRVGHRERSKAS